MENSFQNTHLVGHYFDLTEEQQRIFEEMARLYAEWNEKINLISRKDVENIYERHILHSLSLAKTYPFPAGADIMDLGTGGGFPGIPLAVLFPDCHFYLVDSIGKKIKVVQAVVESLGLKNVTPLHTRAEEIKNIRFNIVVSRAVAPLQELWKWSFPLFKKHKTIQNQLIALKGGDIHTEISNLPQKTITRLVALNTLYEEEFFKEKYIISVSPK